MFQVLKVRILISYQILAAMLSVCQNAHKSKHAHSHTNKQMHKHTHTVAIYVICGLKKNPQYFRTKK